MYNESVQMQNNTLISTLCHVFVEEVWKSLRDRNVVMLGSFILSWGVNKDVRLVGMPAVAYL